MSTGRCTRVGGGRAAAARVATLAALLVAAAALGPRPAAAQPQQQPEYLRQQPAQAPTAPVDADDLRRRYRVVGDAIPEPLADRPGDAERGRRIVTDRQVGLCMLCHSGPFPDVRFQGNIATDLAGTGARWSDGQLRLRIADPQRLKPDSIMPGYYRNHDLALVGWQWRGQPVLSAQQIEDAVAFLRTLR